ncbi:unnamed protein product [Pieris macdunnoughi]|uniref:Uncharacterized protein n=1 Tax=Pieris macdunnoughi TaxID=345717 RepID=A0A821LFW2_9NEOP|nr:unnamed protein product [Pieris macdunnoughi]
MWSYIVAAAQIDPNTGSFRTICESHRPYIQRSRLHAAMQVRRARLNARPARLRHPPPARPLSPVVRLSRPTVRQPRPRQDSPMPRSGPVFRYPSTSRQQLMSRREPRILEIPDSSASLTRPPIRQVTGSYPTLEVTIHFQY